MLHYIVEWSKSKVLLTWAVVITVHETSLGYIDTIFIAGPKTAGLNKIHHQIKNYLNLFLKN